MRRVPTKGSCGDSWRPDDLDAVLGRDGCEAGRIRRLARRRREGERLCRFPDRVDDPLDPRGLIDEQETSLVGGNLEGVRDIAGSVDERSSGRGDRLTADPEGHLAFYDVVPLVFVTVDVEGRAGAPRREPLDGRDAAVGGLARGLDRDEEFEEPQSLAFVCAQTDGSDRGMGGAAHQGAPSVNVASRLMTSPYACPV